MCLDDGRLLAAGVVNAAGLLVEGQLGSGRQVQSGLDHRVVADGDPDPGVGAQQDAGTDRDLDLATTRQRAHDGCATADVRLVTHDHTLRDAAFDHRHTESSGVEVDEALVHDRRSLTEVGPQTDARTISDAHAQQARFDVVDIAREPVGSVARHTLTAQRETVLGDVARQHRSVSRPDENRQHREDAVEVDLVRLDFAVAEQEQAEQEVCLRQVGREVGLLLGVVVGEDLVGLVVVVAEEADHSTVDAVETRVSGRRPVVAVELTEHGGDGVLERGDVDVVLARLAEVLLAEAEQRDLELVEVYLVDGGAAGVVEHVGQDGRGAGAVLDTIGLVVDAELEVEVEQLPTSPVGVLDVGADSNAEARSELEAVEPLDLVLEGPEGRLAVVTREGSVSRGIVQEHGFVRFCRDGWVV